MLSKIEHLSRKLHRRWVPKWNEAFCDQQYGGYHERLGHSFQPIATGRKRLVTQCRQLAVYAHAGTVESRLAGGVRDYRASTKAGFDFLVDKFHLDVPEVSFGESSGGLKGGAWRFSVQEDGSPLDDTLDLYAHAFVIFTMCHLWRGFDGDDLFQDLAAQARHHADQTRIFIDRYFRLSSGFAENLDPRTLRPQLGQMRRQDPHMHLLEAYLFAYELWGEDQWILAAQEILDLFLKYFIRQHGNSVDLYEFMTDDLSPHPQEGHKVKPGHYFEWVWLLRKYMELTQAHPCAKTHPSILEAVCRALLAKGDAPGYDRQYGGIYDFTDHEGHIVEDTKRLWPFAEAIKANAAMMDNWHSRDDIKAAMKAMIRIFESGYMHERGFWTETLNRDLSPATDYMPGTTPYHLYFGLVGAHEYLCARGRSKSLKSGMVGVAYNTRRALSDYVRAFKGHILRKA